MSSEEETVWDTGIRKSSESVLVPYEGKELRDETIYQVKITVWDNYGRADSRETFFETGIFDPMTFQAQMIIHDFPKEEMACPVFYKKVLLKDDVKKARLYATAQDVYEFAVNGVKTGEDRMMPGWTSYHNRLQYQIYDVTEQLKSGENLLEMTVGNGWYKGILGFMCTPDIYGDHVGAFAELHITYADGESEVICTDESWGVRTGEIRYSEIYMGETIDTDSPQIQEGKVSIKDFDKSILIAQENGPVRITERIPAKELIVTPKGERLVDFGQNITGLAEIRIKGQKGQKITVRHAEVLDKDGNFYPETLRQAKSIDTYICNGEEQVFLPHLTFHGFR